MKFLTTLISAGGKSWIKQKKKYEEITTNIYEILVYDLSTQIVEMHARNYII